MCAQPSAIASHDSLSRRPAQRPRFPRSVRPMKDAKVALDVIIRPSIQLWKLALGGTVLKNMALKRPRTHKTVIPCDDVPSTSSSQNPKKKVRFDEQPITITRKSFFERHRRDSSPSSSPARPCLIIREYDDVHQESLKQSPTDTDCRSVYEDCFSDHPGFLADLHVLDMECDDDERCWNMRLPKRNRRSEFYETESGIATFDRAGYANYCLARWLEKQREGAKSPKKLVFEVPAPLPHLSRTLPSLPPLPTNVPSKVLACPTPLPPAPVRRSSRSFPWRMCKYVEDELQNAIAVLLIGLSIHTCLFLFLLYDILTRGFVPSDSD